MHKRSEIPWLERRLEKLLMTKDQIEKLAKIEEGVYNQTRLWSPLKLVFLHYVASIYTAIISNQKKMFPNMYYIDLFSGSGINNITETKDLCLGSPLLIAEKMKETPFDKMFFCECDRNLSNALELRLKRVVNEDRFKIFHDDCNSVVKKIISELDKPCHSLIFIDPYSMEISWKTMEHVLSLNADIVFVFQTVQTARGKEGERFKEFFKESKKAMEICNSQKGKVRETLLELYINDIIQARKPRKTICEVVRIHGEKFYYDILFLTKETSQHNPWMNGIVYAKKEVEKNTGLAIKRTLNVLTGRQTTLRNIFNLH